ncbi:MAG: hypothetical protein LBP80_01265 [Treponema sp.]|nr:hypothetical protein [Treponema sp.]
MGCHTGAGAWVALWVETAAGRVCWGAGAAGCVLCRGAAGGSSAAGAGAGTGTEAGAGTGAGTAAGAGAGTAAGAGAGTAAGAGAEAGVWGPRE